MHECSSRKSSRLVLQKLGCYVEWHVRQSQASAWQTRLLSEFIKYFGFIFDCWITLGISFTILSVMTRFQNQLWAVNLEYSIWLNRVPNIIFTQVTQECFRYCPVAEFFNAFHQQTLVVGINLIKIFAKSNTSFVNLVIWVNKHTNSGIRKYLRYFCPEDK